MAAYDKFHNAVCKALDRDGWTITHDPITLHWGVIDLYIDLGAEKLIAAEKDQQKIAVEIKSFLGPSFVSEFHLAIGQVLHYRMALDREEPDRVLYLAVPLDVYETFFKLEFTQASLQAHRIKVVVYDADQEVIVTWKE